MDEPNKSFQAFDPIAASWLYWGALFVQPVLFVSSGFILGAESNIPWFAWIACTAYRCIIDIYFLMRRNSTRIWVRIPVTLYGECIIMALSAFAGSLLFALLKNIPLH
jgi:hypothetical protein